MKKLMIAACAVAFAAGVQAASVNWASSGAFYDTAGDPDWPTVAEGTTAYFVFASSYAQSDLVADFAAGSVDMAKLTAINSGSIADDGTVAKVTGSTTTLSGSQDAYIVILKDAENMFISDVVNNTIDQLDVTLYGFTEAETGDIWALNGDASAGYSGAGWYSASSGPTPIPEPTSGLLLLLGVAGLALRRRRA